MSSKSSNSSNPDGSVARTARGLLAIGSNLPRIAEPAARKRGFTQVRILTEWPAIVGETIAAGTIPEKLVFRGSRGNGILHIRVMTGLALKIQHLSPHIIERINTFFGYSAVRELRYTQGPVKPLRLRRSRPPRRLTPFEEAQLEDLLESVVDQPLRDSLRRLGKAVYASSSRRD